MDALHKNIKKDVENQILTRLQAPTHITKSHFSKHEKVEGYVQNENVGTFYGCDRLMKADNLFGTIQLGYHPKMETAFLFATVKTSIFDTISSKYQKELREDKMKNSLKQGTQNTAFSSARKTDSATVIYKKENKPWSEQSITPYILKQNMESLQKTMPFVQKNVEIYQRNQLIAEDLKLKHQHAQQFANKDEKLTETKQLQQELLKDMELLNSVIVRKSSYSVNFFDRINTVFDLQKKEMFDYYRRFKDANNKSKYETAENKEDEEEE